jgi:hypothetical protein
MTRAASGVGVFVGVGVLVEVGVRVGVNVGVRVGVEVFVGVGVRVGVDVGVANKLLTVPQPTVMSDIAVSNTTRSDDL